MHLNYINHLLILQLHLGTKSRKYSFMSQGPVSPLSFAGTPLFLNVFNSSETFVKENKLLSYTKKSISNSLTYTQDNYDF